MAEGSELVSLRQSGGQLPIQDSLVITVDGQASVSKSGGEREFVVNEQTLAILKNQLIGAEFRTLKSQRPKGGDQYYYSVSYQGRTVGFNQCPRKLQPAFSTLLAVMNE